MKYNPRDEDSIKAVMAKANVVINLIGTGYIFLSFYVEKFRIGSVLNIWFNSNLLILAGRDYGTRNYSLEEVNHHMAERLAIVCYCTFCLKKLSAPTYLCVYIILYLLLLQ